ncbi:Phytochrome A [Linum grandiflorum]
MSQTAVSTGDSLKVEEGKEKVEAMEEEPWNPYYRNPECECCRKLAVTVFEAMSDDEEYPFAVEDDGEDERQLRLRAIHYLRSVYESGGKKLVHQRTLNVTASHEDKLAKVSISSNSAVFLRLLFIISINSISFRLLKSSATLVSISSNSTVFLRLLFIISINSISFELHIINDAAADDSPAGISSSMSDQHSGPLLRPLLRSAVSSPQIAGNINSISSSNPTIVLRLLFIILFVGVFPISNLDTTTSSSSSSFSSSSSPEFFRMFKLLSSATDPLYMENMDSIASLVMAVIVNESDDGDAGGEELQQKRKRLWGLVVCHNTSPRFVPFPVRSACEFLAQVFAIHVNKEIELENQIVEKNILRTQALLCDMLMRDAPLGIVTQSPNVMDLVKCDGAALFYKNKVSRFMLLIRT